MTWEGRIGVVPAGAGKGDVVWIFPGCNVPMVLRTMENGWYKVVGGCYLDGFMDGEAMEGVEDGRRRVEEVVLC